MIKLSCKIIWSFYLFRLVEVALVNGFVLYRESSDERKSATPVQFRRRVIDGLLEGWQSNIRMGRRSDLPAPARMTGRHFPAKMTANQKPDCVVCSRRPDRRKQTSTKCRQCDLPMCSVPCFEHYHSLLHYKL